jgi:Cryptococcal mannosyltransferase 1
MVSEKGLQHMAGSSIAIAGLARDCANKLDGNIQLIEKLCSFFKLSTVVVVENGSKDATRIKLNNWAEQKDDVNVIGGVPSKQAVDSPRKISPNPYYSKARIGKLAALRNQYIDFLRNQETSFDYLLVLDFDVDKISLEGILNSFDRHQEWDVITAYGYSLSPRLRERYHDSFALVPLGEENLTKTEKSIKNLQPLFRMEKKSKDLVPVYAAYGGLSIYKLSEKELPDYWVAGNQDLRVEAQCEHISFCSFFTRRGAKKVYINPQMHLRYQSFKDALIRLIYNK